MKYLETDKKYKRYTITTALPYANGPVHIGHLAGVYVPADIYARYLRSMGEEVILIGGSDEHGVPITIKARKEGVSPQDIVDRYHNTIKQSFEEFGISFDIYSRTTSKTHYETASDYFKCLYEEGKFVEKTSKQYYDPEAKTFLADRYITGTCPHCGNEKAYGDQCEACGTSLAATDLINPKSALSGAEPELRETKHWYLPLEEYEQFMRITPCPCCHGKRLKESSLAVTVADYNIYDMTNHSVKELVDILDNIELTQQQHYIGDQILKEIRARVGFLKQVGLEYLTLTRATGSLSGGEAQRIRLATQIGSGLVGVAYILDEPSIGLHQRDNDKLLKALMDLKNLGNTLIVVEHDEDTMRAADYIVDIGPAAGSHGGEVIATGTAADIMKCKKSITGAYLSGRVKIPVPEERRKPTGFITVKGARENNLKNIDVDFPLGIMTCVTGVSGSGKSSLTNEILYKHLAKSLNRARCIAGDHDEIVGIEQLDKIIDIDQSPIGRTPRSNPATYTGVFDMIRDLFAATPDAKAKGYKKGQDFVFLSKA